MFGKNEKVGPGRFADVEGKLLVTSYFATMQGEGPFSGRRAVFVRLAKCNLTCSFCDTWFDSGDWYELPDLCSELDMARSKVSGHAVDGWGLVITGGEPLLQPALIEWLETEPEYWDWVQIESNGLVKRDIPENVTLVISPKCAEDAKGKPTKYLKPNPQNLERADCLKFVMSGELGPYWTIPDWAFEWREKTGRDIFVSPMNFYNREPQRAKIERTRNEATIEQRSTIEEVISFWEPGLLDLKRNEQSHKRAAHYAIEHGLRFQVQAHLYAGVA